MVVMQNERSASDAEMFPAGFKALGLGKTVGVPTMGAVIGTGSYTLSCATGNTTDGGAADGGDGTGGGGAGGNDGGANDGAGIGGAGGIAGLALA